ncbi:MAG: hypothetical protein R2991_02630 [Thermoanaerobaculia bacterium]
MNRAGAAVALAAALVGVVHTPAVGAQDVDLGRLLADAKRVQQNDLAAWQRYRFQREVVRRSLDAQLRETKREDLWFIVRPKPDGHGFDEQLVLIDGKVPSERLREEHHEAARFTKHYLRALEPGDEFDADADPIVHLWDAEHYDYAGRETIDGVPCHRVEMRASAEPVEGALGVRLAAATAGTLWLAVDGLRIVRSQSRLARDVRLALGLGTLSRFDVRLQTVELPDGARLPAEISVASHVSVLGTTIRKSNLYRYSRFALEE